MPLEDADTLVFVGDYVDRGEDAKSVIETVMDLVQNRKNTIALRGNHEEMFLDFLAAPQSDKGAQFIFNGGSSTLASYADESGDYEIPEEHLAFLRDLPTWHVTEHHVFVHAGLPLLPFDEIDPTLHAQAMLWIRGEFLRTEQSWGRVVVHGHTPVAAPDIRENRINIDTGCVFGRTLTALELPGNKLYQVRRGAAPRVLLRDPTSNRRAVRFEGAVPVDVQLSGGLFRFETLNYSELGMLIRENQDGSCPSLAAGEQLSGVLMPGTEAPVTFRGVVLRKRKNLDGFYYAVQIYDTRSN